MEFHNPLVPWLITWVIVGGLLFVIRTKKRVANAGLVFAYFFGLWAIHWLGAFIYTLPWYSYGWQGRWYRGFNFGWVEDGFRLSTYGIIAYLCGVLLFPPILLLLTKKRGGRQETIRFADPNLAKAYLITGAIFYFILQRFTGRIPTVSTILSSGINLMAVGFCLILFKNWREKKRLAFLGWLSLCLFFFPTLTTVTQGFASFGTQTLLGILTFVGSFYRPRWKLVIACVVTGYLGLSLFVVYMRDRPAIREVVWGKRSLTERAGQLFLSLRNFEWLNLRNEGHLRAIDGRLNQNLLVGAGVQSLTESQDFARGETFLASLLVLVPRALWSEKPHLTGGSELVSRFTNIQFSKGTTVGIGQVLEFYANFGMPGVVIGFFCVGAVVGIFDLLAGEHLLRGDWQRFGFWFLAGLGFIQTSNSLVEMVGGTTVAIALMTLLNRLFFRFRGRRFILARP